MMLACPPGPTKMNAAPEETAQSEPSGSQSKPCGVPVEGKTAVLPQNSTSTQRVDKQNDRG